MHRCLISTENETGEFETACKLVLSTFNVQDGDNIFDRLQMLVANSTTHRCRKQELEQMFLLGGLLTPDWRSCSVIINPGLQHQDKKAAAEGLLTPFKSTSRNQETIDLLTKIYIEIVRFWACVCIIKGSVCFVREVTRFTKVADNPKQRFKTNVPCLS
jgi:hypothetical protein